LAQFVKWDEQGFDFLRHWTIYTEFENTPYLIWFSVIEDTFFKVSVRASFNFSSQNWIYAKDLESKIAQQVDKVFILAFLNKVNCR
jgi:hypothetical protein